MARIGIPSALLYYIYYPFWLTFFNEIGVQVVTSGRTTKNILDKGVREALADACVPIKLFFGHVMDLKDKADYLFIPRVVCLNGKTIYCPKFLGLPDMIRHSLDDIPPIIDVRIDTRQGRLSLIKAYLEIGSYFGASRNTVLRAYCLARAALRRYNLLLMKGFSPIEAMELIKNPDNKKLVLPPKANLRFAVLGYPYAIYDSFISVNILDKLKKMGVNVLTAENINPLLLSLQKNCGLPKRLFWTFSDKALKAAHYLFRHDRVDAVLHLTAFGCGPDSLLNKFIELEAKQHRDIPFMTLMIDEHTGEAGMATRLEAFVDMVRRRKEAFACQN
ncbi:acyl-CoA dehydratase activase-related protein [Pelotomaculum propionicicum]|uniref:acyl-CoA dehydratase activase-related protein n=1 Tax=Pelotomaculum propionicicum TaxID=258475 RepID=UPI003B764C9C